MKSVCSAVLFGLMIFSLAIPAAAHDGPHEGDDADHDHFVATQFHSEVKISEDGNFRIILANGIPDHQTGQFPNRNNPNSIRPQRYHYRVPLRPQMAQEPIALNRQPFGIALNGVPFDPGTAEFWQRNPQSGWNFEAIGGRVNLGLDRSLAHVQPTGAYHYHGIPKLYLQYLEKKQRVPQMVLLGYAADGFPIYGPLAHDDPQDAESALREMKSSYRLKQGFRPSGPGGKYDGTFTADYEYVAEAGDLDECNGRTGVTPEYPQGTYYYVLTESFPYIPRLFRGTPDPSFARHGPPPGRGGPGGPGGQGRPGGPRPPRGPNGF